MKDLSPVLKQLVGYFRTILLLYLCQFYLRFPTDPFDPAAIDQHMGWLVFANMVIQALGGAALWTGTMTLLFGPPPPRA